MAAAAPFVKLLRQLSAARDDYRTGALDIMWDGGKASLFLVFGQPNHAVLDTTDGKHLEGQEALSGLVGRIPRQFQVSSWRKEVVRTETLRCTLDDLMEPFAQLAGSASPSVPEPDGTGAPENASEIDFSLEDFPLLPLGTTLWADAAASVVHLDVLVPSLPETLVVLTGARIRAAGIVSHQRMVDAVWVGDDARTSGEQAIMAMMAANQGTISGYRLEAPGLAEALPMLWRLPAAHRGLPVRWLDPSGFADDLERQRQDCAITVTGPGIHGVALWVGGAPLAVYSESQREPAASVERFLDLLRAPGARLTMRQQPVSQRAVHIPEASFHAFVAPAAAVVVPSAPESNGSLPVAASEPAATAAPQSAEAWSANGAVNPPEETEGGTPPPGTEAEPSAPLGVEDGAVSGDAEAEEDGVPDWLTAASYAPDEDASPSETAVWQGLADEESVPVSASDESDSPPSWDGADSAAWGADGSATGSEIDGVKKDLIQIVSLWLGGESALHASQLIERTRPTVGDVMATIDAIAALPLPGHEPSVIQAMAREMRFHAAEYLSGV